MATLVVLSVSVAVQALLLHKLLGAALQAAGRERVTVQRLPSRYRHRRQPLPRARLR